MKRHAMIAAVVAGCGGSTPSTVATAPSPPAEAPAAPEQTATTQTHGDPATRRNATVIAARDLHGGDAGRLVNVAAGAPAAPPSGVVWIELAAAPRVIVGGASESPPATCAAASPCMFYEHAIAAGQQRVRSLAWQPYGPERRFAPVWGSVESGPVGLLVEIKAGTASFWHAHRHDVAMVVLAGTVVHVESGQAAHTLESGSYVLQPGGYKHSESCQAGMDCVLYIRADRGFAIKPL